MLVPKRDCSDRWYGSNGQWQETIWQIAVITIAVECVADVRVWSIRESCGVESGDSTYSGVYNADTDNADTDHGACMHSKDDNDRQQNAYSSLVFFQRHRNRHRLSKLLDPLRGASSLPYLSPTARIVPTAPSLPSFPSFHSHTLPSC